MSPLPMPRIFPGPVNVKVTAGAASGTRTLFHTEAGKDSPHKAIKVQMRPNPLAK